jgi:hypothetical protein
MRFLEYRFRAPAQTVPPVLVFANLVFSELPMSESRVTRKIVDWTMQPRQWWPVLDCGHRPLEYDPGVTDEEKAELLKKSTWECIECGREKDRIASLEHELRELKAKRRR